MIESKAIGPLFNGRALHAVEMLAHDIEEKLAEDAVNEIHETLDRVLQHPTGYYESRIQTDRVSYGKRVTDGGVIYGPWLEGVSSRNQTTSFKGYHTFREVAQSIGKEAEAKANALALKYVSEMN